MLRIAVLLIVLSVWLGFPAKVVAADPPAPAARPDAELSESEAIHIAEEEARSLNIDLDHFDPPSATYISDGHRGKWHVFFMAKSHNFDACFSVDIYRRTQRPHFSWCS